MLPHFLRAVLIQGSLFIVLREQRARGDPKDAERRGASGAPWESLSACSGNQRVKFKKLYKLSGKRLNDESSEIND
ncbi:hypothetical protein M3598_06110 [Cytobacillus oceanisediminis]|jgi:hypothetical protein|uniref:hypothetical protein n=1 Tax=Cytobacillus TaxID=2675230 RepID=UPI00203E44BE|nr:hypothetical protein [Cytobacillus oceanisediminis]MCM3242312.1 hypothetical protein [Cytobacillus oceanisediminis]MCM3394062.1 hypothetical protein [Cytobacillus oceanisediminis]